MAKVQGWDRLQRRLKKIPKAVKEATQPAITAAANDIASVMKILVPVDSGDLLDSIAVTPGGQKSPAYSQPGGATVVPENAALITAGNAKARYPHLVEYGTQAAPAQPYFWPGYRFGRKKAAQKIKRGMSKAIRSTKNGN